MDRNRLSIETQDKIVTRTNLAEVSQRREHVDSPRTVLAVESGEQGLGHPDARLLFAEPQRKVQHVLHGAAGVAVNSPHAPFLDEHKTNQTKTKTPPKTRVSLD